MTTENLFKTLLLCMCFVGPSWTCAQSKPTATELRAQVEAMGQKTFTRKNGEVLTFEQIRGLPSKTRDVVLDDEMTEAEYQAFDGYMKQRIAAINADFEETKQRTAAIIASSVPEIEETANKLRLVLGAGVRPNFPISELQGMFQALRFNRQIYMKAGLKEETYKFLESLANLPDWPKKLDERS